MALENSPEFVEKIITRALIEDKRYVATVATALDEKFFESKEAGLVYRNIQRHFNEYKQIPTKEIIINSVNDGDDQKDVKQYLDDALTFDFDLAKHYDFLLNETDNWLKESALKFAIMDSVDIIDSGKKEDFGRIQELVKTALTKTIKMDLGLDYFTTIGERLKRMFNATEIKVPSYLPQFDEYISGGFIPFTLSVGLGRIHGNKSGFMLNVMARQALHGHNPVMFTLEMSEDAMAQRMDAIYSGLNINRMYNTSNRKRLIKELKIIKDSEERGNMFIKQFPTGTASINEFRTYLHELSLRDHNPDIIFCDYVNLMKPSYNSKGSLYEDVKRISEELRAMSFEFAVPIVSVSQLNREGMRVSFDEVDFTYSAESAGLPATADFMWVLGVDHDRLTYQNELHYKITKNRLGGRVGDINKFYVDPHSLKIYDETELDVWMTDAEKSGCRERPLYEPE